MIHQYASQAGSVVSSAAGNFQGFAQHRVNFASADVIWHAPSRPVDVVAVDPDWRTIELHRVAYAHAGARGVAEASLALRCGERVALVGPSGSGKSTLMRVIAGLYDADHGHVAVDGVAHLNVRPVAPLATYVPQDAEAFDGTVLENVVLDGDVDGAALAVAIAISGFDAVLASLPDGLDAPIAERGANLSGGQRQRLCLARGVYAARQSSLLLLDEPTSALDPLSEAAFMRALMERRPDACIVASVHRMALLEHFDRVVLMVDGRVVDSGEVAALAARQPLFASMLARRGDAEVREAA